jgi:integrase
LLDRKGGFGAYRERWMGINEELAAALARWLEERPMKTDNVFMQLRDYYFRTDIKAGSPFIRRKFFMKRLCQRAGVKPFGLHALRHWGAARIFKEKGLNEAQIFMGHSRATTTDRYIKSAGLYADKVVLVTTIANSPVGAAVSALLQKEAARPKAAGQDETVTEEK